jgi:hypothetical protein
VRPQSLPDADLPYSLRRPCRRQVDEVDAGDEQQEDADGSQQIDMGDAEVRLQLASPVREQMDVRDRLQIEDQALVSPLLSQPLVMSADGFQEAVAEPLDRPRLSRLHIEVAVGVPSQPLVGIDTAPHGVDPDGGEGDDDVKREVGVGRQLVDTRHLDVELIVPAQHLSEGIFVAEVEPSHLGGDGHAVRAVEHGLP